MNYLRAENLSKRYGERLLFDNLNLTLAQGDRVALIAKNGTGKTSLLNILAQRDEPDSGSVVIDKNIHWAYLEQDPTFNTGDSVWDSVFRSNSEVIRVVADYELCMEDLSAAPDSIPLQEKLNRLSAEMDRLSAWDVENRVHTILTQLNLQHHLHQTAELLSGGQRKRLALARVLIQQPDLLILDEPTNHLDIAMIEWLEGYLKAQDITLLLVTHDRYFLDNVCNEIIELDLHQLFIYRGNYAYYLEKKALREANQARETDQARKMAKKELEWMRRQPKARTTKSKSRIDAYYDLKEKASFRRDDKKVEIQMQMQRLGSKILETHQLSKAYGEQKILDQFTYLFKPGERIGIVGRNGIGKSTFLNLLQGLEKPDAGKVIRGDTVRFGYFGQQGLVVNEEKRVIEIITDIAEYLEVGKGQKLSAIALLRRFLFDDKKQYNPVSSLSGGEKRRLYLLTVLMQKPNFLILDEPTNDLDIDTLNVLEDFLESFEGCLLVVTHDRYFIDNLVDKLFIFEGDGKVRDFNGNYQDYLNEYPGILRAEQTKTSPNDEKNPGRTDIPAKASSGKKKLTFNEQRELEQLNKDLPNLNQRREELEQLMNTGGTDHQQLLEWSRELEALRDQIDNMEMRWLELNDN